MVSILLVCLIILGRLAWFWLGPAPSETGSETGPRNLIRAAETSFCRLLLAFALSSIAFFVLADAGILTTRAVVASALLGATGCLVLGARRGHLSRALAGLKGDLVLGAALVGLVTFYGLLLPPIDTSLAASDSSVYLATAHQLARSGSMMHRDPLVGAMSVEERDVLFSNRFEQDHTGAKARFPGGVVLVSSSSDQVSFYFYHLFPIWLAVGLETVGDGSYLDLLAVFASIAVAALFFIGWRLRGVLLGVGICAAHLFFEPQAFFTRLPSSELLAQSLFLSGLFALLRGIDLPPERRRPLVRLAALLWGALFLCRVDAIPFVWLGLASISLLPARLGIRREDWGVPMLVTLLFAVVAVWHQLANGIDYVGALSPGPLATTVGLFASSRRWASVLLFAGLAAAGVAIHRADPASSRGRRVFASARLFGLAVSSVTLVRFLSGFDPREVVRHLEWVAMYTTPAVLAVLGGGVLLAALAFVAPRSSPLLGVAFAVFAGPAGCYLINPMVVGHQPWAMRRFVPIIFPLLFVLALYGWQRALRWLFRTRPAVAHVAFGVLSVAIAARFVASPTGLTGRPATARTKPAVCALGQAVPDRALILVPDENAGLHLATALEYECGRQVLLLPLRDGTSRRFDQAADGFVGRQLAGGRQVFVILAGAAEMSGSMTHRFRSDLRAAMTLNYEAVPFRLIDEVPGPPASASLRVRVLELLPQRSGP